MIVSTCGFGSTGSSAVSDYLLECENISVFDNIEFDITSMPDGLEDLEYQLMIRHTREKSSIYAIQRFKKNILSFAKPWCSLTKIDKKTLINLTDSFIENITQIRYCGFSPSYDKRGMTLFRRIFGYSIMLQRLIPFLEKKGFNISGKNYYPLEYVNISINPENFYTEAQKYIQNLLEAMGADFSKIVVLDQGFSGDDPAKSFPFYKDPYAIVVDRDPRDIYIFGKEVLKSRGRFMPLENVEDFIQYYKLLRKDRPYLEPNDRVLKIQFEDMIFNYEETSERINKFLNVKNINPRAVFKPEVSAANTNLVKKFPKYESDVKKIAAALPEYLFHFENYKEISNTGEMFFGKSPLNNH